MVLALIAVQHVVVLFHRVVLVVSSSHVPVIVLSLSHCLRVGRSSFGGWW